MFAAASTMRNCSALATVSLSASISAGYNDDEQCKWETEHFFSALAQSASAISKNSKWRALSDCIKHKN